MVEIMAPPFQPRSAKRGELDDRRESTGPGGCIKTKDKSIKIKVGLDQTIGAFFVIYLCPLQLLSYSPAHPNLNTPLLLKTEHLVT